jgi:hypothetical protein
MAMGIEKLGLPSLTIPDLFLAEKINLFPDRNGTPSPPTGPPPPGLPHPPGLVRQTIIPQNVRDSCSAPVRRGSDPGTLNRAVIESVSYKCAVQGGKMLSLGGGSGGGGDSYAKLVSNLTRDSPTLSQIDSWDPIITSGGGHGSPPRRINPKIVELMTFSLSPSK